MERMVNSASEVQLFYEASVAACCCGPRLPAHGRVLPSKETPAVDCQAALCDRQCQCIAVTAKALLLPAQQ